MSLATLTPSPSSRL
jgi:hypothetical protein